MCHPAWSTSSAQCLPGVTRALISVRCRPIASVLHQGRTGPAVAPVTGQIAPKM
jgi:hypothetical protein